MQIPPDDPVPRVSVIIVSDYDEGEETWTDERAAVRAFSEDDPGVPWEAVVMRKRPADGERAVPDEIARLAPKVSVRFEDTSQSARLKDLGLAYCRGELVAVVEADCLPEPGWLRHLIAALDADPLLDVVSGRTVYGMDRAILRVLSLLDRGFIEGRHDGKYFHVSNNGALYRRQVLERYPYPDDPNPFVSAELRSRDMHKGNVRIGFERIALMRHALGGIAFITDLRRNKGYQNARTDGGASDSPITIAVRAVVRSLKEDLATVRSVGRSYLRWSDWPLLVLVFLAVRVPEFLGALSAGQPERFLASTKYR